MANFAAAMRAEITRVAKRQSRDDLAALKKSSNRYRTEIAELKRRLAAAERLILDIGKQLARVPSSMPEVSHLGKVRFSGRSLRAQRERLGLTRAQLAPLMEVSVATLYNWETGHTRPGTQHIQAWARLRQMSRADIEPLVASLQQGNRAASGT